MSNNPFIQYYNVFAQENSKYHLTIEELYLYGVLSQIRNVEHLAITNVDIIHQYSPIEFFSREKEAKQRIRKYLLSLKEKEVITFDVDEIKNNTLLVISFMQDLTEGTVKGFEKVEFVKFNSFPTMTDAYIYFTVKRWDKLNGFICDYIRWSTILDVAEKTARTKIDEAIKKKIIYKNIGDYKDESVNSRNQKKQEKNTYKTIPFSSDEKSTQTKKVEQVIANEKRIDQLSEIEYPNGYMEDIGDAMYFFRTYKDEEGDVFPDSTHYALYLEVKEDVKNRKPTKLENDFIKVAEKRIGYLKNNPQFQKEYDEGVGIFKRGQQERVLKQLENATNAVKLKDDSIVIADEKNINSIDWKEVDSFYYGNDKLEHTFPFEYFQTINIRTNIYENRPDMLEFGWGLYKEHVKSGKNLTHELANDMQSKTFEVTFSSKNEDETNEYSFYDYSIDEQKSPKNKKDERDISDFLDAEDIF